MEKLQDSALIKHYLDGNGYAFEVLYNRYRVRLFGYLNGLLPHQPAEAEDIYQQTWLKVIARLPEYQDQGCFGAWLFRIGRNLLIDHVRRQKRQPQLLEIDREEMPEISAAPGTEPWRTMDESELGNAIRKAVETLSPDQKEVFLLRQEGVSFKEIAEIQQCSLNTALARMQYALKKLKKQLVSIDQGGLIQ
ncbi:MAG: sigma-70 family RNA polymerase sigma factor [Lentisphaeria bacterium]|nr:sigma-70 family RNA polymerase sigma factor [Lentisphaeria bacterium]